MSYILFFNKPNLPIYPPPRLFHWPHPTDAFGDVNTTDLHLLIHRGDFFCIDTLTLLGGFKLVVAGSHFIALNVIPPVVVVVCLGPFIL